MKFISHLLLFVVGAAVGAYWGVQHPSQATDLANREDLTAARLKQAVASAKLQLLDKINGATTRPADVQQIKQESQRDLDDANAKLK